MTRPILTQARLKELLHYNVETGEFTRLISSGGQLRGTIAGYVSTSDGYIKIAVLGWGYQAHRLAWLYMTGAFPAEDIDHINHCRDDNRWFNLRAASRSSNLKNQKLSQRNTSGCVGVNYHKTRSKWVVRVSIEGKSTYVGVYKDKNEAISVRKGLEVIHGYHENHGV